MGFIEAVNDLAQSVACRCPDDDIHPKTRTRRRRPPKQATLTDVLESRRRLPPPPARIAARHYLKGRGVGPWPSAMAWATRPEGWRSLASVFPANTTTRCWKKAAWSSSTRKTAASATTASATG